jgi:hypothetical protein
MAQSWGHVARLHSRCKRGRAGACGITWLGRLLDCLVQVMDPYTIIL